MNARLLLLSGGALMATALTLLAQGNDNPTGVNGSFNGEVTTGGMYDPYTANVKRVVTDMVVPGCVGKYPLHATRYYNSRKSIYGAWVFDQGWTLSEGQIARAPDGREIDFAGYGEMGTITPSQEYMEDSPDGNARMRLPDGGRIMFETYQITISGVVHTRYREKQLTDPYGLVTTFYYDDADPTAKPTRIAEPGGKYLKYITLKDSGGRVTQYIVEAHSGGPNDTLIETVRYTCTQWGALTSVQSARVITRVDYDDGTFATLTYKADNVYSKYALLGSSDEVRFGGPMQRIEYDYNATAKPLDGNFNSVGKLKRERRLVPGQVDAGAIVSTIDPDSNYLETRGDSRTRHFTYSSPNGAYPGRLTDWGDFQGHLFHRGYGVTNGAGLPSSVTDTNGNQTKYTYSGMSSQITKITHPGETEWISYSYDFGDPLEDHYMRSVTNERGKATTYSRDSLHRITRTDYPNDNVSPSPEYETFIYNTSNQVLKHRRKNGAFEYFAYDATTRLLTTQWNPTTVDAAITSDAVDVTALTQVPATTFTYYAGGTAWQYRLMSKTLPANGQGFAASETYEYDYVYVSGVMQSSTSGVKCGGRGVVTKITHNDGYYQRFGYDISGNKLWEENELGQRTSYTYDEFKRVLSAKNEQLNQTASTTYPSIPSTAVPLTQTDVAGVQTVNALDEKFQVTAKTVAFGTALAATSNFTYDNMGNGLSATDALGHQVVTVYDTRDRKQTITAGFGTTLAETSTYYYDAASNVTSIQRPDQQSEVKTYDAMNRVLTDTLPVASGGVNKVISFVYNPSGTTQSVSVSQTATSAEVTRYTYDASDRKLRFIYPDDPNPLGSTDYQEWAYDNAGNAASRRTVNGATQSFTYDARNRNVGMTWSNQADWASFTYDNAGRQLTAANANSTVSRTYDAAGRMLTDSQALTGGGTQTVQYAYDTGTGNAGRMTEINIGGTGSSSTGYTGGSYDVRYAYDVRGRLSVMSDPARGNLAQYTYDAASNVTRRDTLLNGSYLTYGARDALNRMPSRAVVVGGVTVSSETYGYDNMNRLTSTDRTEDAKRDAFTYDFESQMTGAQYGLVGGTNPSRVVGYSLDLLGNRTNVNDAGVNTAYVPNNINQYTGNVGADPVTNGSEHEIANYKGVNYGYINDGRLTSVGSTGNTYALKYDAFGRTVSRTLNGATTYYYYDGEKAIVETGAVTASNVYGLGIDEILLRFEGATTRCFYQDHEGSVTHVATGSAVVESYRYDAFGAPSFFNSTSQPITSSLIGNRFLFTGREWNQTFGFYEYRARADHPVLGRFMSEDPKGFDAGDYNLFRYCGNDPEDKVDPSGMSPVGYVMSIDLWAKAATNSILEQGGGPSSPTVTQAGAGNDSTATDTVTFELKPIAVEIKDVDRVRDKNNNVTRDIARTNSSLDIKPVRTAEHSYVIVATPKLVIERATKVKEDAKQWYGKEQGHVDDFQKQWFPRAQQRVEALKDRASSFKSAADAMRAMDSQLRQDFFRTHSDSHRARDNYDGNHPNCEHCYQGDPFLK